MTTKKDPDVDGGYAWCILTGCFLMYMLVVGTLKAYGVLYTEMLEYYSIGSGNTAFIGSICILCMMGLGPLANFLSFRFSFRKIAFLGGLLISAGMISSAFVPRVEYMFLTLGLCSGIGYGFTFAPCSTIISYYFEKNRALANGLTVSASGIGVLGLPFLYMYLIELYSFKGALWVLGAVMLNVSAAACIFVQPKLLRKLKHSRRAKAAAAKRRAKQKHNSNGLLRNGDDVFDDSEGADEPEVNTGCCGGFNLKCSLFKNPRFTLHAIAMTFCMNGYANNIILIPSHVKALGYDNSKVVLSVSVLGGCEVVARVFFGWLADRKLVKEKYIFFMSMVIAAAFAFMAPFFESFAFMIAYAAIVGIFPGSFWSLISVLLIDVVGMEDFTQAFGLISMCLAVGSVFSQPIIGWLQDATGNWHASFILSGWMLLMAGFILALEPLVVKYCAKKKPANDDDDDDPGKVTYTVPHRRPTYSRESSSVDTGSLMDEDNDVSFSSHRISKIYRPYQPPARKKPVPSPRTRSAPLARPNDI